MGSVMEPNAEVVVNGSSSQNNNDGMEKQGFNEIEAIAEPIVGMEYDSAEDFFVFYSNYAKHKGFGLIKRTSKRDDDDGNLRYLTFSCVHAGKSRSSFKTKTPFVSRLSSKTGCKAKVRLKILPHGGVIVTTVVLEHNHVLNPGKAGLGSIRRLSGQVKKRKAELHDQVFTGDEARKHENLIFNEMDCKNFAEHMKRLRFGEADAGALCNFFARMQEKDSRFFHLMETDGESCIRSLFWADGRSRAAYEAFGDVIMFDTKYLTSSYDIPLVVFAGVNHHGQPLLFGCGLLASENVCSFIWLFRTFFNCMSGCRPYAMITDESKAIGRAVELVFFGIQHGWGLGHIMRKLQEKLSHVLQFEEMKAVLHDLVYDSLTESDFEEGWALMVENSGPHNNEWLLELYKERRCWVPVYAKRFFWAGMSTMQRNERVNSFFDDYVHPKTSLKNFIAKYENALKDKVEKERLADHNSFNSWYPCISNYDLEKQFQVAYTNAKFAEFQAELKDKFYCYPTLIEKEGCFNVFEVAEDVKVGEKRKDVLFKVHFNESECEVSCKCRLFESRGILCRHSLSVLTLKKVKEVPSKYVLLRWRKDLKRGYNYIRTSYLQGGVEMQRYETMCKEFHYIATGAADLEDKYDLVMKTLRELKAKLLN